MEREGGREQPCSLLPWARRGVSPISIPQTSFPSKLCCGSLSKNHSAPLVPGAPSAVDYDFWLNIYLRESWGYF